MRRVLGVSPAGHGKRPELVVEHRRVTAARALPLAGTLPVGIVTAVLGAPALAFLLARSNR